MLARVLELAGVMTVLEYLRSAECIWDLNGLILKNRGGSTWSPTPTLVEGSVGSSSTCVSSGSSCEFLTLSAVQHPGRLLSDSDS
jgi:hypothetical protein